MKEELFIWIYLFNRVEKLIEQKKDVGWKSSRSQKTLFYFQLIPKHQQQKEIFACETEENRNVKTKFIFPFRFSILL